MALQIQNVLKSSLKLVNTRSLSSGIFSGVGQQSGGTPDNKSLHMAVQRDYPMAEQLPLPPNVDIAETSRFSPLRNRDITSSAISVHNEMNGIDVTLDQIGSEAKSESAEINDPHLNHYDCNSVVNLCSIMQSTVPEPYGGNHKFSHLNMPGGSWCQQTKYLSHELNSAHYTQLRQEIRGDWYYTESGQQKGISTLGMQSIFTCSHLNPKRLFDHHFLITNKRFISLSCKNLNEPAQKPSGESDAKPPHKETGQSKLKKAIKEYGSTVLVFHVTISLASLGMFYVLVSSGLDVMLLLEKVSLADKIPKFAENASTFVIAYAIHKLFAPVRISITLGATPFIVRFLRNKGILKK